MPTLTASPLLDAGQSMSPQFPSNDVDSYWYHQSSTTQQSEAEDAEDAGNNNVGGSSDDDENSSGRHSAGALPHQYADRHLVTRTRIGQVRDGVHAPLQPNIQAAPLLNAGSVRAEGNTQSAVVVVAPATQPARREGAFPSIPRNASIEESRLTMLAVLRAHRTFASGHNSDDSDFEAYRAPDVREVGSSRRPVAMSAISMTNPLAVPGSPPPYDSRTDKPEAPENDGELGASGRGSQGSGRAQAESDRRLVKWLMKNTVDVRPLDCALLRPGMKFSGVQELTRQSLEFHYTSLYPPLASINSERWDVEVVIQSVDMKHGKLAGLMKAINVPRTHKLITTSWKGEVVDFVNYTPRTNKWNARCTDDTRHWSLFPAIREHPEAFLHKWPESLYGKRMPQVLEDYLFMRWKGVYFDPSMRPYQRLTLETKNGGKAMSFAASALC
ncbi:hypothetical protein GQ54DRAFT_301709 [Martensiomyces pterosporus]|nr:hypothetical protein GQ54DRAFT_301709 [Martensiomyces pterosporus]